MRAPLAICTKEEQRSVIRFLSSEGVKPIEIIDESKFSTVMHVCVQQVYEWTRKFMNGISSVPDSLDLVRHTEW